MMLIRFLLRTSSVWGLRAPATSIGERGQDLGRGGVRERRMSTRIAVITDAHANLPALDAALAAIRGDGVAAVYHTGDAIGIGPFPAEVLDRLLHEPRMRSVMGNHDAWFAFGLPCPRLARMGEGGARAPALGPCPARPGATSGRGSLALD